MGWVDRSSKKQKIQIQHCISPRLREQSNHPHARDCSLDTKKQILLLEPRNRSYIGTCLPMGWMDGSNKKQLMQYNHCISPCLPKQSNHPAQDSFCWLINAGYELDANIVGRLAEKYFLIIFPLRWVNPSR